MGDDLFNEDLELELVASTLKSRIRIRYRLLQEA